MSTEPISRRALAPAGLSGNLGFAAWLAYGVLTAGGHWLSAGLAGVLITLAVLAVQWRRGALKLMEETSLGYFAGATLMLLAGGQAVLLRYHLLLIWGVFALVAWLSLASGLPFTLQYTREQLPREVQESPGFHRMNRRLTAVWSLVFTLGAVLGGVSMKYGHALMFGMIVPMAAMGAGLMFSRLYPRSFARRITRSGQTVDRIVAG